MRTNRSYIVRSARMRPQRRAVYERLSPLFCVPLPAQPMPVDPAAFFPQRAPVVLDIGFGMGRELAAVAARFSACNFLGVEVYPPGVGSLLVEIERRALSNVRIVQADAVAVCAQLIAPQTIGAVHIFFPDPWFKKRHHKRRLITPGFVEIIARILKAGGYCYAVTDWADYSSQMASVFEAAPQFANRFQGGVPSVAWRPTTAFEKKGHAKGHQALELIYERLAGGESGGVALSAEERAKLPGAGNAPANGGGGSPTFPQS